jgi:hypothetical protein
VVEHLPSKHEALEFKHKYQKKKKFSIHFNMEFDSVCDTFLHNSYFLIPFPISTFMYSHPLTGLSEKWKMCY